MSSSSPPPIPLRGRMTVAGRLALIFGVVVTIALLIFGTYHWRLSHAVSVRLKPSRTAREPLTLKELNDYYPAVPAASNAAPAYAKAFAAIRTNHLDDILKRLKPFETDSVSLSNDVRLALEEVVEANRKTFELLDEATTFNSCHYPIDYRGGYQMLLPHLPGLRTSSKLQRCKGILSEQNGDTQTAIDSLRAIIRYSDSLETEPDLVSALVQFRLHLDAAELLAWILNHRRLTASQLDSVKDIFGNGEPAIRLERAVVGERCMTLAIVNSSAREMMDVIDPGYAQKRTAMMGIYVLRLSGKMKQDQISVLDRLAQCQEALRLPLPARFERAQQVREAIEREAYRRKLLLTGMLVPAVTKVIRRNVQHAAEHNLVEAAIAIERFRLAKGRLPASLGDLAPGKAADFLDPFDGQPLRYVQQSTGYLLYSVGPDRSDDHGSKSITSRASAETPPGDLIFRVTR